MRTLLATSSLLLAAAGPAPAQIAIPIDVDDLVRMLLQRRPDERRSARIRLRDAATGTRVWFELGAGRGDEIVALFSFERDARRLYIHTVRFRDHQDRILRPRVIDLKPLGSPGLGEVVALDLPDGALDWLAAASTVEVTLEGWEHTFTAVLEEPSLRKVREFRDRIVPSSPQTNPVLANPEGSHP
jgi:hypothetical protein